jgi:hypothetical protein
MSAKQTAKWVFAAAVDIPDERISKTDPAYGKWRRTSLYGIDSRGALWRDIDTGKPEFIGFPPELP